MNVILTIASMSVSAGIMFILYLAVQRTLQRYLPTSILYVLMLVILFRLLIPYSPEFALINSLADRFQISAIIVDSDDPSDFEKTDALNPQIYDNVGMRINNDENNASEQSDVIKIYDSKGISEKHVEDTPDLNKKHDSQFNWGTLIISVWLIGVLGKIIINSAAYRFWRRKILLTAHYSEIHTKMLGDIARGKRYPGVFISPSVNTPMLLGVLKCKIILPMENYTPGELECILCHELCHYRRFDVGFKWLASIACSLHWFNPLMIPFRHELENICEFSCDEAVTRDMDTAQRKAYIRTLLKTVSKQLNHTAVPITTMSGSAKRIKERFLAISRYTRPTPARTALSIMVTVSAVAIGLCLGTCTPSSFKQSMKDKTDSQYDNLDISESNSFSNNSGISDSYLWYQYGYESMNFEVTDRDAVYDEKRQAWTVPKSNDYYEYKPTLTGSTEQRVIMRSVLNLLNYEKYKRIGEVQSTEFFSGDAMHINFYDELHFYLEKDGNMFVWLDSGSIAEFLHLREYPDYLKSPDTISVFEVPDDLYGKVASILYLIAEQSADESMAKKLEQYPFEDIDNCFVYSVLCGKLRIISDDYNCDFYDEVGDYTYDLVWDLFKGIGQCNQIQPQPKLSKTDCNIMIIGSEDYGEEYVDEYITVYADNGVICTRFKGDEMWYSVSKNLVKRCREIAECENK